MKYILTLILTFLVAFFVISCGNLVPPAGNGEIIGPEPGVIEPPTPDADPISLKVLDQNDITVYFKGQSFDKTDVKFIFEIDNSSDKNIAIRVKDVIVNDIMTEPECYISVSANEVTSGFINWGYNYEISTFHKVSFIFIMIDTETNNVMFESEKIIIDLN